MTPDEWSHIKSLFDEALDLESGSIRERFVASIEPESTRAEVKRLLSLHDAESAIFDKLQPDAKLVRSAAELRSLNNGDVIAGRFRIARFIAEGGMGEVYEAHDEQLNERVAVKTLRWETAQDTAALARFRQEIQLARRVTNPNVCRIHDLWEHKTAGGRSIWFLTMEFLEGETLAHRIERGPMPVADVLPLLQQMATGLGAAHDAGIVHRDFKSSNVILVPRAGGGGPDRAVVTDFGLSRSFDVRTTATGAVMGTPAYMAPEQIEGGELGPATDVYALGVVLYEMLTGMLPFRSSSPMALAVKKLRETPVPPSSVVADVPAVWDQVVARCMQYRMADRFQTAGAVLDAIETGKMPALRGRKDLEFRVPVRRWQLVLGLVSVAAGAAYWYRSHDPGFNANAESLTLYQEGVGKIHDGAPHVAAKLFRSSLEVDPGFVAARARLAQAYAAIEMVDASRNELLRIPSENFAALGRKERLLVDGARFLALNQPENAVVQFRDYASLEGNDEARLGLAEAYLRANKLEAAIELCGVLLREHPNNGPALLIRARAYALTGKTPEALKDARGARDQFELRGNLDGKLAAAYELSALLLTSNRLTEMEQESRAAIEATRAVRNTYYEVLFRRQLASVLRKTGRYVNAGAELKSSEELARNEGYVAQQVSIRNDLAGLAFAQSQLDRAELEYRQAIGVAERLEVPYQRALAQTGLAEVLIREGKGAEGMKVLEQASKYFSDRNMGINALELERLGLNSLIAMNDNALAVVQAGRYLEKAKQQNAKTDMEMALKIHAHLFIVSGEIFKAFEYQHQAQALAKSVGKTIANDLLNEARLHIEVGDVEGAEGLLNTVAAQMGDSPGVRSKFLQCQARLAAVRKAWPLAEDLALKALKAAQSEVDRAEINLFSARVKALRGQPDAKASLELAAKEFGSSADGDRRLKYESTRAELLLALRDTKNAAAVALRALKADGEKAQRLAAWQCSLVGFAADPSSPELQRLYRSQFEALTSTWPAQRKESLRGRGDFAHLFARIR